MIQLQEQISRPQLRLDVDPNAAQEPYRSVPVFTPPVYIAWPGNVALKARDQLLGAVSWLCRSQYIRPHAWVMGQQPGVRTPVVILVGSGKWGWSHEVQAPNRPAR